MGGLPSIRINILGEISSIYDTVQGTTQGTNVIAD